MKVTPFAAAAFFLAASTTASPDSSEVEWSYLPDQLATWYTQHGDPLPKLALELTVIEQSKSYVVKLDCLACPFRLRKIGEVVETWQEPSQDNSLLLNITIDDGGLLLNGDRVAPLAPMPLRIFAFQTPANLSQGTLSSMTSMHMLDRSWALGTKYGYMELQYEHALVGTGVHGENWVQFDVTGIHQLSGQNPGSYVLEKEGQKMVQVLLQEKTVNETLRIKDVQVIQRESRAKPFQMPCGKFAITKTSYNPQEWDHYGKFGTFSRLWHVVTWSIYEHWFGIGVAGLVLAAFIRCRSYLTKRRKQAAEQVQDDIEAVPLVQRYDDAPPTYDEVAQGNGKEEER